MRSWVFKRAWQLAYEMDSFAECLRRAWAEWKSRDDSAVGHIERMFDEVRICVHGGPVIALGSRRRAPRGWEWVLEHPAVAAIDARVRARRHEIEMGQAYAAYELAQRDAARERAALPVAA